MVGVAGVTTVVFAVAVTVSLGGDAALSLGDDGRSFKAAAGTTPTLTCTRECTLQ